MAGLVCAQTHATVALTRATHDNTSIISAAHSQTHIQTLRLRRRTPLALIKGRNVIDRGEISRKETERWRERRKKREGGGGWPSPFSVTGPHRR